mmetsp:Transcript_4395/g.13851  ORF Transcript_4395/g.13851 Transcript_4395/m.13851 type:complete len:304 (+) Transcript_4395:299-1210(+)
MLAAPWSAASSCAAWSFEKWSVGRCETFGGGGSRGRRWARLTCMSKACARECEVHSAQSRSGTRRTCGLMARVMPSSSRASCIGVAASTHWNKTWETFSTTASSASARWTSHSSISAKTSSQRAASPAHAAEAHASSRLSLAVNRAASCHAASRRGHGCAGCCARAFAPPWTTCGGMAHDDAKSRAPLSAAAKGPPSTISSLTALPGALAFGGTLAVGAVCIMAESRKDAASSWSHSAESRPAMTSGGNGERSAAKRSVFELGLLASGCFGSVFAEPSWGHFFKGPAPSAETGVASAGQAASK